MNHPIRLLIVDDHVMIRLGLAALLADEQDIEIVGEAGQGAEAIDLFEKLRPKPLTTHSVLSAESL